MAWTDPDPRDLATFYSSSVTEGRKTSGWAIAAFVLGVLACVPLGVIFGIVALAKGREYRGRGLAIAGIVLSLLWIPAGAFLGMRLWQGDGYLETDGTWSVGDCIEVVSPENGRMGGGAIDCAQSHGGEVFAILDTRRNQSGPQAEPERRCQAKLDEYASPEHRGAPIYRWGPSTPEMKGGNYSVLCVATFDPPRTGSIRAT